VAISAILALAVLCALDCVPRGCARAPASTDAGAAFHGGFGPASSAPSFPCDPGSASLSTTTQPFALGYDGGADGGGSPPKLDLAVGTGTSVVDVDVVFKVADGGVVDAGAGRVATDINAAILAADASSAVVATSSAGVVTIAGTAVGGGTFVLVLDAGATNAAGKLGLSGGAQRGTGLVTDPNNCGACGTACGSYGQTTPPQGGASFLQGTCTNAVCSPYVAYDTALDCWDYTPAGCVVGGPPAGPTCVSVLSSPQNCGGLGWACSGACRLGECTGGSLVVPKTLTIHGSATTAIAETLTVTGGVGPYLFSFSPQGNQSGGTVTSAGLYTPGTIVGAVDVVMVQDSVGNLAQFSITVT
jgi:hypothetical protein